MKKFIICIAICLLLSSLNHAKADLTLTTVDGDWDNPVGPGTLITDNIIYGNETVTYGNQSQDQIRWGKPVGTEKSGLGFAGIAPPNTNVTIGDTFQIGQLAHFNAPIYAGSQLNSADLIVNLTFDSAGTFSFTFTFGINETLDDGTQGGVPDIISFPSSYPAETFEISGDLYTLQLLGFGSDPLNPLSQFSSPEGDENNTLLWGRITEPIPVPGALLLGMIGLSVAGVKLRKHA